MWLHMFAKAVERTPGVLGISATFGDPYEVAINERLLRIRTWDFASFSKYNPTFILNRGGYFEYVPLLQAAKQAASIYVGCGAKWNPSMLSYNKLMQHDCVLVDCKKQQEEIKPKYNASIFPKPAVDSLFYPIDVEKKYDLVFNCHNPNLAKGSQWLAERIPDKCKVLVIGPENKYIKYEADKGRFSVHFTGKINKKLISSWACQARVGIVCDDGKEDSGPRVLPEFLAMNIPIVVRDCVRADLDNYVTPETGRVIGDKKGKLAKALDSLNTTAVSPRKVYENAFQIDHAVERLLKVIKSIS